MTHRSAMEIEDGEYGGRSTRRERQSMARNS